MKYLRIVCICLIVSASFAGEIKKVDEKYFDLEAGGYVTLIGNEGRINVTSWDKEQVYVKITKHVWEYDKEKAEKIIENLKVEINHSGNGLEIIEVDLHKDKNFRFFDIFEKDKWHNHYRIDYELIVPEVINLKIENDEGDVEIRGISGYLNAQVDEGNLNIYDLREIDVKAFIDEGNIELENVFSDGHELDISLDEGNVRLYECTFDKMHISSDEGDIILKDTKCGDCKIFTDEGDIDAQLVVLKDGRCKVETDEGDIILYLPENCDISLNIETNEGRIKSDFPLKITERDDEGEKLTGIIGAEFSSLTAYTDEGNILIKSY